jgi:hypothetical protein
MPGNNFHLDQNGQDSMLIKKDYVTPVLTIHGTVETLTHGLSLPGDDTFTGSTPG